MGLNQYYLFIKSLHIIFMVSWFAGLFYLPRLFVYHAEAADAEGVLRFKIMERRLYKGIMWPAAILTTVSGLLLLHIMFNVYAEALWLHLKLGLVGLLWIFHLFCGHYVKYFAMDKNDHGSKFYRFFNEVPTLFLVLIIFLVILKPSFGG